MNVSCKRNTTPVLIDHIGTRTMKMLYFILSKFKEKPEYLCFKDQAAASLTSLNGMHYLHMCNSWVCLCKTHLFNKMISIIIISVSSDPFSDCSFRLSSLRFSLLFQVVTNCKNTVQGFKRFHGRAFSDPYVQRLKNSTIYDIVQMPTGTTGIKVSGD